MAIDRIINAEIGASHNANGLSALARPWRRSALPTAPCWMKNNSARKLGGFTRLNRIFDGRLDAILGDINDELWSKSA